MALNIDLDGFGFLLDSDSDVPKLSPTLNKQPPISPIESESSSGISSLDSDDLKKQLLSSPPTISISNDQDDDDQQSNDGGAVMSGNEKDEQDDEDDADVEVDEDEGLKQEEDEHQELEVSSSTDDDDEASDKKVCTEVEVKTEPIETIVAYVPVQVIYQNRNILNLAGNVWNPGRFMQTTILPKSNLTVYFQNRAQYWRLTESSGTERPDPIEKCSCCDFSYPTFHHLLNSNGLAKGHSKNPITDSLLTFLKNNHVDYNNPMPNKQLPQQHIHHQQQPPRIYNNNNAPYANAYQHSVMQQQYQNTNNGYYQNNGYNPGYNGGYNSNNNGNSALALLNLMNQPRNVSAGAFQQQQQQQQPMNNNSRFYNNNMNNTNNGYGLYKQF